MKHKYNTMKCEKTKKGKENEWVFKKNKSYIYIYIYIKS